MSETELSEKKPGDSPSICLNSLQSRFIPRTPQEIAIVVCALGMVGEFFGTWTWIDDGATGATLYRLDPVAIVTWIIPVLALATIVMLHDKSACRRIGTAAGLITFLVIGYAGIKTNLFMAPAWGARLTIWSALGLFAFSGDLQTSTTLDYVARKLGSRKAAVYSHWGTLMPDCHFSTKDFYSTLETAIRAKEWPGADIFRLEYAEAGLLSHKREYFRVIRGRQVFDVCAATFGKDYFFSVREAEIPVVVSLRAFLVVMLAVPLAFGLCLEFLGLVAGSFAMLFLVIFAVWFLFNILKLGLTKVDSLLIKLPVVGAVYEAWFRRDTYFQQDTRLVFLQSVTELVKKLVEDTTSEKGVKYLNCFESQPILDDLYKRSRVEVKAEAAAAA